MHLGVFVGWSAHSLNIPGCVQGCFPAFVHNFLEMHEGYKVCFGNLSA